MTKLFSIKEEYTEKIYSKQKKLELRRQNVNVEIDEVCLIYTTNPVKEINGYFIVKKKVRLPINELWEKTKKNSGVDKKTFFKYFEGCKLGTAILFKDAKKLRKGIKLRSIKQVKENFSPPQSYFSVDVELINLIDSKKSINKSLKELITRN